MTKTEILFKMLLARKRHNTLQWSCAIGKLQRLEGSRLHALKGISNYIKACESLGLALESNYFIEVLADAEEDRFVFQLVDNDSAFVSGQRNAGRRARRD